MPLFFNRFRRFTSASRQRQRRAATAVEMALLTPVFFMMLIGITEICLVLTAQQLLESAAFTASRLAKTGYVAGGSTQTQTVSQVVMNELSSFGSMFDTSKIVTTATAYSDFGAVGQNGQGVSGYGAAQQIVVYTITYPWTLFTPMLGNIIGTWNTGTNSWVVNLSSRIVVRNEPYGS
jgi:Flp pilus assembly protein TadG